MKLYLHASKNYLQFFKILRFDEYDYAIVDKSYFEASDKINASFKKHGEEIFIPRNNRKNYTPEEARQILIDEIFRNQVVDFRKVIIYKNGL